MALLSSAGDHLLLIAIGLVVFTYLASIIHNVYLGPLSKFPGPKLAAATILYEFYYDVISKGQYTFKIRELHKQYGGLSSSRYRS